MHHTLRLLFALGCLVLGASHVTTAQVLSRTSATVPHRPQSEHTAIEAPVLERTAPLHVNSFVVGDTLYYEGFTDSLDGWTVMATSPSDTVLWTYSTSDTFEVGSTLAGFEKGLSTGGDGHAVISFDGYRTVDTSAEEITQTLISPLIDTLAAYTADDYIELQFDQAFAYLGINGASVQFSADNGTSFSDPIVVNPGLDSNTLTGTTVAIKVPDEVVGSDSVRIAFTYAGGLYAWAIDDISLAVTEGADFLFLSDFSEGFDGWEVETGEGDTATWRYETDPELVGTFTGETVESPSVDNGFALFNFDEAVNGDVTAEDAVETLISPAFDVSDLAAGPTYQLTFYQGVRYCCTFNDDDKQLFVSVSLDGGETFGEPQLASGEATVNDYLQEISGVRLPAGVDTATQLVARFTYDGAFYFAAIDDIAVEILPEVELELRDNFYAVAPNFATPSVQVSDSIRFLVDVRNNGAQTQTFNVVASVFETNAEGAATNLVFTDTLLYSNVVYDSLAENQLFAQAYPLPTTIGNYLGSYTIVNPEASEPDAVPADNQIVFGFQVTEAAYRKGPPSSRGGIRSVDADGDGSFGYEAGNIYYMPNPEGTQVDSVSFRAFNRNFTAESLDSVELEVFVYGASGDENGDGEVQPDELEELASVLLKLDPAQYLGARGDTLDVFARFEGGVDVSEYPAFGVSVVYYEPPGTEGAFFIGLGESLGATDFIRSSAVAFGDIADTTYVSYFSNEVFTQNPETTYNSLSDDFRGYNIAAFISGTVVSTEEVVEETGFSVRPNPATAIIYTDFSLGEPIQAGQILLVNALGQLVRTIELRNVADGTLEVPTADLNNGLYFLRLQTDDNRVATRKVYVRR